MDHHARTTLIRITAHMAAVVWVWTAMVSNALALDVLVNQVGFEPNAPKVVHVQRSADFAGDGTFSVRRASDNVQVYSGTLARKGPIWDKFYWEGDFGPFKIGGNYNISATVNGETGVSYNFTIGNATLLSQTGVLTYRYYLTQRCGVAVTDPYNGVFWHGPCHLDDGIRSDTFVHWDGVGGWHDAGDYNKFPGFFAADGVFDLLWLYENNPSYYDGFDLMDASGNANANGIPDIIDEALYQARWLAKMIDTNGHCLQETRINRSGATFVRPESDTNNTICSCNNMSSCDSCDDRWIDYGPEDTPQEPVCCGALIKMHMILASKGLPTGNFAAKALAIWNHRVALAIANNWGNNMGNEAYHIWSGLYLYSVFGQQDCYDRALAKVSEVANTLIANPAAYDTIVAGEGPGYNLGVLAWFARNYPSAYPANDARTAVQALMSRYMSVLANNPIGLIQRDESGTMQYFPLYPKPGLNRLYGLLCWGATEAHKLLNNSAYLRFALDQYNWIMGANYNRVCMMEGAGDFNLYKYHTRYYKIPGHESGKQPGVVPNGYIRDTSTGFPFIDLSSNSNAIQLASAETNEGWVINSAAYAMAVSGMNVFQDQAQYVSDTIPATMTAGVNYTVSITMKNTSYMTWDSTNYKLGAVDDSDPFAGTRQTLPGGTTVAPGQQYTFTFTMTAPATPGTYTTDWRTLQESVNWFGDTLTKQVQVGSSAPPAPVTQFTATPGTHQITLAWTNPSTAGFNGTMIRYSTVTSPVSPIDGTLLINKANTPASNDSTVHTGLVVGTRYYYSAFAHNGVPAYATAVTATAFPNSQSDFDHDGDVDQADFAHLQTCFYGTAIAVPPTCQDADLNGNASVDSSDLTIFLGCLNGSDQPVAAGCAN